MALAGCQPASRSTGSTSAGEDLPAFTLTDAVTGQSISKEDLLGKPYVVSVFGTWCPPCKLELAAFQQQLWEPLKDDGIGVYGINLGNEDAATIKGFAESNGLTFPLLVDEEGEFAKKVGVTGVPHSLVVGKDGKIIEVHQGFSDEGVAAIKRDLQAAK